MYKNENEQLNQSIQIIHLYTFSRHGLKEINFFLLQTISLTHSAQL